MQNLGRECKELMVSELVEQFNKNPDFFVTGFSKLTVSEIGELRKSLNSLSCGYQVVKKSIAKQALRQAPLASKDRGEENGGVNLNDTVEAVEGAVGITFAVTDPFALSKILVNFAKEHPGFIVQGGLLEGDILSQDLVKELAILPSREVLLRKLLWTIKAPINGFANVLASTLRGFLYAIKGIQEKQMTKDR